MLLWEEIKRRNVVKVGIAYLALAWLIIQVTDVAVPALNLPEALHSIVFYIGLIGFPFAIFFAWAFELTPEGIKPSAQVEPDQSITQNTSKQLEHIIVGLLVLIVIMLGWQNLSPSPSGSEMAADQSSEVKAPPVMPTQPEEILPSIAVLPFVNMSADQEQEFFSDGISEEILNVLAKIPNLHVTSRSSAFAFKGKDLDLKDVADQLGVNHILEGSVRKAGNQVRITAQLIEAESDRHLWSETYDRELVDIFAVQDEISNAIVVVLREKLIGSSEEPAATTVTSTTNPEAYTAYLKGFQIWQTTNNTEEGLAALAVIDESISLDDSYAPAHTVRALIYNAMTAEAYYTQEKGLPEAWKSINRALELDPNDARAYIVRASLRSAFEFDFAGAKEDLDKAATLNPNDALVFRQLSQYSSSMGDFEAAIEQAKIAVSLDPLNIASRVQESRVYTFMGDPQKGLEAANLALTLNPDSSSLRLYRGYINIRMNNFDATLDDAELIIDEAFRPQLQSMAYYGLGNHEASEEKLQELITVGAQDSAYQIAEVYGHRGDVEKCLDWLEKSYEQLDPGMQGIVVSPWLEVVRKEPRYLALLEKMKLVAME